MNALSHFMRNIFQIFFVFKVLHSNRIFVNFILSEQLSEEVVVQLKY